MNVSRLDRIAAPEMDRVQRLAEADKVLIVAPVARPAPAGAIEGVGGAGDGAECDMTPADRKMPGGIAGVEGELPGREPDMRLDQRWIEAHAPGGRVDVRAGLLQHRACAVMEEIGADFLQRRQSGVVDRFQFVPRDEIEGRKQLLGLARRRGLRLRAAAVTRRPSPSSGLTPLSFRGHECPFKSRTAIKIAVRKSRATDEYGVAERQLLRAICGLFGRAKLRRLGGGFHFRRAPGRSGGKARDQPGAEQRDRLVAEVLRVGRQIITITFVEPEVERLH